MPRPRTIDPTGADTGTERVHVRLTPAQFRALERLAKREGVTLGSVLRQALQQVLDETQALNKNRRAS